MTTGNARRSTRTEQLPPEQPAERPQCRQCGAARGELERFCESCGHDDTLPVTWSIEISADRTYHERVASGLTFPAGRMATVLVFQMDAISIGRRNDARGLHPDVDLSGEFADPGVSHLHASIQRDSRSMLFAVTDLGSTNGTTINDDERPIESHRAVQVVEGDQIHVGAWTTIRFMV